MSTASLLAYTARDDRRRARIAAGSVIARYAQAGDLSYVGASTFPHQAAVKPRGVSIPEGVVVVATRRDAHGRCTSILIEAFEHVARVRAILRTPAATVPPSDLASSG